jgi:hypothetical protein
LVCRLVFAMAQWLYEYIFRTKLVLQVKATTPLSRLKAKSPCILTFELGLDLRGSRNVDIFSLILQPGTSLSPRWPGCRCIGLHPGSTSRACNMHRQHSRFKSSRACLDDKAEREVKTSSSSL